MNDLFKNELKVTQKESLILLTNGDVQLNLKMPKNSKMVGMPSFGLVLIQEEHQLYMIGVYDLLEEVTSSETKVIIASEVVCSKWKYPYLLFIQKSKAFRYRWSETCFSMEEKMEVDLQRTTEEVDGCTDDTDFQNYDKKLPDLSSELKVGLQRMTEKDSDDNQYKVLEAISDDLFFKDGKSVTWKPSMKLEIPFEIKEETPPPQTIKEKELPCNICSLLKVLSS